MASVYKYPNFAVLCSFFERYGERLQLPDLTIPELQIALEHELVGKIFWCKMRVKYLFELSRIMFHSRSTLIVLF